MSKIGMKRFNLYLDNTALEVYDQLPLKALYVEKILSSYDYLEEEPIQIGPPVKYYQVSLPSSTIELLDRVSDLTYRPKRELVSEALIKYGKENDLI